MTDSSLCLILTKELLAERFFVTVQLAGCTELLRQ